MVIKQWCISAVFSLCSLCAGMAQADMTMAIPNVTGDRAAADIEFRVAYPAGWKPVTGTSEKGVVLALDWVDGHFTEMLMLRVEKMTEEEAAWVFAEKGHLTKEAGLQLAQRIISDARNVKVSSLENIRIDGQPAVLITMEKQMKNAGGTFFQKEMIQVVWAWGRKIIQNYLVTGPFENRVAIVKRFSQGERGDPGTFMGSLQFLNRDQMIKQVP